MTLDELSLLSCWELNQTLAGLLGWKYTPPPIGGASVNPWAMPGGGYTSSCPDYCSHLNSVANARRTLAGRQTFKFIETIYTLIDPQPAGQVAFTWLMMNADARTQTIALIMALGVTP